MACVLSQTCHTWLAHFLNEFSTKKLLSPMALVPQGCQPRPNMSEPQRWTWFQRLKLELLANKTGFCFFFFNFNSDQIRSDQLLSRVRLFATPWIAARQASLSITNWVHSDSRPSSQWCHPAISSSVIPFSSCPQSFPASGSFQMSHLLASGSQSIGVSASTSVLPMNTQNCLL